MKMLVTCLKITLALAYFASVAECWRVKQFTWSHNVTEFAASGRTAWIHSFAKYWNEQVTASLFREYDQFFNITVPKNSDGSPTVSDGIARIVHYDSSDKLFHSRNGLVRQVIPVYEDFSGETSTEREKSGVLVPKSRSLKPLNGSDQMWVQFEISFAFKDDIMASSFPLSSIDDGVMPTSLKSEDFLTQSNDDEEYGSDVEQMESSDSDGDEYVDESSSLYSDENDTWGASNGQDSRFNGINDHVKETILPCMSLLEAFSSVTVPATFVPKTVADLAFYYYSPHLWFRSTVHKPIFENVTETPLESFPSSKTMFYTYQVRIPLDFSGRKVNLILEAHYSDLNDSMDDKAVPKYVESYIKVISDSDDGFYPNTLKTLYRIQNIVNRFSEGVCDSSVYGKL